jgi:hypothetical protein
VAGAVAGVAGLGLGLGMAGSLALGAAAFLIAVAFFAAWAKREIAGYIERSVVRFPTPPDDDAIS